MPWNPMHITSVVTPAFVGYDLQYSMKRELQRRGEWRELVREYGPVTARLELPIDLSDHTVITSNLAQPSVAFVVYKETAITIIGDD